MVVFLRRSTRRGRHCHAELRSTGRRPGARPAAGTRSARAAATDQIDDRQEDDRAEERDPEAGDAEVVLVDRAGTEHRCQQPAAQHRADDADDDVQDDALLPVGSHDHAGDPTDEAAHYKPNDEVHALPLSKPLKTTRPSHGKWHVPAGADASHAGSREPALETWLAYARAFAAPMSRGR